MRITTWIMSSVILIAAGVFESFDLDSPWIIDVFNRMVI